MKFPSSIFTTIGVFALLCITSCNPSGTEKYDGHPAIEYYIQAQVDTIDLGLEDDEFDVRYQDYPLTVDLSSSESNSVFIPYIVTPDGELINRYTPDLDEKGIIYRKGWIDTKLPLHFATGQRFSFEKPKKGKYDLFIRLRPDATRSGPDSVQLYVRVRTNEGNRTYTTVIKRHPDLYYNVFYRVTSIDLTDTVSAIDPEKHEYDHPFIPDYYKASFKEIQNDSLIEELRRLSRPSQVLQMVLIKEDRDMFNPKLVVRQPNGNVLAYHDVSMFENYTTDSATGGRAGCYEFGLQSIDGGDWKDVITWTNPEKGKYEVFINTGGRGIFKLAIVDENEAHVYLVSAPHGVRNHILTYER